MTNQKIKQIMTEVTGFDVFPDIISESNTILTDSVIQQFAERIINDSISVINTGDANTNTLVINQIKTYFEIP